MTTQKVPDLFVVGAPKCGTTSFHTYLAQHPDVFMSDDKEPTFFGSDIRRARRPYPTLDAYLELFREAREGQRAGESSVAYLSSEKAPEEIHAFNPESQIVIMLRNPVDVMHSLHGHMTFIGEEPLADFRKAVAAEADRERAVKGLPDDPPPYLLYRRVVRFGAHVERWIAAFGRRRVHVIFYEDVVDDVEGEFERLLRFLDVDPTFRPSFDRINASRRPRSPVFHRFLLRPPQPAGAVARAVVPASLRARIVKTLRDLNGRSERRAPMPPDLRRQLTRELAPDVDRLARVLDRDLSHWSTA